jgi:hypothetical protein
LQKGVQPSGFELEPKDSAVALHDARELASIDAGNLGTIEDANVVGWTLKIMLEDQVAVRVGHRLRLAGLCVAKIPLNIPVVLHPGRQFGRRSDPLMKEVCPPGFFGVKDATGRSCLRKKLGRFVSRFFNRDEGLPRILIHRRHSGPDEAN